MSTVDFADYFLHPTDTAHRRYEALRAVFAEDHSLSEAAQRFDVSYGTIRNWVSEHQRTLRDGGKPPFSFHRRGEDLLRVIRN